MNKKSLLTLLVLTSLVGCTAKTSSSSSSNSETTSSSLISTSSEVSSSSTGTSSTSSSTVESSSTTPSSSSTPAATPNFLDSLKDGFSAKSVYSKQYDNGTPTLTLLKTYVGADVAKWEQYSKSSWDDVTTDVEPYKFEQYEKDANEDAQVVKYDTAGNVVYTPLLLKDQYSGENIEAYWSETNLDNAFARLTIDDFTKSGDFTYDLDLSEEALADETYMSAVEGLAIQMYMILGGSEYVGFYFIDTLLESYTITVDENYVPISYDAKFVDLSQSDGWGGTTIVHSSISGTFESLGADSIKKAQKLEGKYEELDNAFASLQKQNYEFNAVRNEIGDGVWTSDSTQTIKGKSDGLGNFVVDYVDTASYSGGTKSFGYSQISENKYRKYLTGESGNIWDGNEITGSALDILPSFAFSSALFEKNEELTTETTTVYNFVKPSILGSEYCTDNSIINFGFDSIQPWLLAELKVEVSENTVVFNYVTSDARNSVASFTNIGEVEEISIVISEAKDLLAGSYTATKSVKGTSIKFDVVISDDLFTFKKDGEDFGSYKFTLDEDYKITLDSSVESNTFTISQTTGTGENEVTKNYSCYITANVTVDDICNPTKITFSVKAIEEGKTSGSTVKFSAERV